MTVRLVDRLGQTGVDEKTHLRVALFPECLFGFPPKNLMDMLYRLKCSTCMRIIELVMEELVLLKDLERRVDEFQASTKQANEDAIREYGLRCQKAWIFRRFVKKPIELPMPDHTNETWYLEASGREETIEAELAQSKAEDSSHWGNEEEEAISRELLVRFLSRDSYVVT